MQTQIILQGVTLEELQDSFKSVVQSEVERIISKLPKVETPPEWITRKETAFILGISLVTLNEWTKSGVIKASRVGTRVRYLRSDVHESLKQVETLKYRRS